ncbi:MAG TPA: YsnF/AvaK domain-containing protein [Pyrinomonadaceae bacterium]|nr:YsnF/AvaK domain-containing protein [Pyrinomonadaceae bacterium]
MSQQRARTISLAVIDRDGVRGTIDATEQDIEHGQRQVLVRLEDGRRVLVPTDEMRLESDGSFTLPFSLSELIRASERRGVVAPRREEETEAVAEGDSVVVPVVAEQLDVRKRVVEGGGVRIRKTVREREEIVDEPLMREEVRVERVPVGRIVDGPVPVRHVGKTMIVSLLEEVLVVEKRLMLKEELHITKEEIETYRPQRVRLRSEEAFVERVDDPSATARAAGAPDDEDITQAPAKESGHEQIG